MSLRKRYTFFLDVELSAGLKALKARDGMPQSDAVRRAIAEFLAKKGIGAVGKAERKRARTRRRP